ncbi:MAG: hypothetical protein JRC90_10245 [Deltaproteobacteria bacterium]|nr:hypothetical protein [Deltaproteobacteria bacterium]
MGSNQDVMGEQLPLFEDRHMLLNGGLQYLEKLELDEAKKAFERYRDLYRAEDDINTKLEITQFLIDGFLNAPDTCPDEAVYLYGLWDSFESYVESIGFEAEKVISKIKSSFFRKLFESVDRCNLTDAPFLSDNIPMGYVYMQAGRYDMAIKSLQACIPVTRDNAVIYGYLGDAYILRGEPDVARRCYLEACLIDPAGMDWDHVKDRELVELKDHLIETLDMDELSAVKWMPGYACVRGLFAMKTIRLREEIKGFVDEYIALQKVYYRERSPALEAGLFIRAIILCDNESIMKLVKGINFIDVRRQMKETNPSLFSEYLRYVEGKKHPDSPKR